MRSVLASSAGTSPTEDPALESARVYLVDPDPRTRSRYMSVLGRFADVAVLGFGSAEELLGQGPIAPPACVITEMDLPGMDGLELQRRLLARKGNAVPVLFVVGNGDIRSAVEAVRLGAIDFLIKPCLAKALQEAVTSALRQSARRR